MRVVLALCALALAAPAAVVLHERDRSTAPAGWTCYAPSCEMHSTWHEPVAIGIGAAVFAAAIGVLAWRRPRNRT